MDIVCFLGIFCLVSICWILIFIVLVIVVIGVLVGWFLKGFWSNFEVFLMRKKSSVMVRMIGNIKCIEIFNMFNGSKKMNRFSKILMIKLYCVGNIVFLICLYLFMEL